MEPPFGRALDAGQLAATPLLESVNWLLEAVHGQQSAFGKMLEELQVLQAFKETTDVTLTSIKEDMAGLANAPRVEGEIAAAYTKDVVERAREASKASVAPGGPETSPVPKMVSCEELSRVENELKVQLRELQESLALPELSAAGKADEASDARLVALELQISELKDKLESVHPALATPGPPHSGAPGTAPEVAPSEGPEETADPAAPPAVVDASAVVVDAPAVVVNPPAVVVNPPAVVVNPPAVVVNPPATAVTPSAATQLTAESAEVLGRVKALEDKVLNLTEALEVLRESLDFPDDLGPEVDASDPTAASDTASGPTLEAAAVQTSQPGSKEVPSSGRGSRPASRENWRTLASSLESLDLRVTALEQWRGALPAPDTEPPLEPCDTPAVPTEERADSIDPGPGLQPNSGPEVKVPPLRLPKTGQAVRLSQCLAEEREELEERLSILEETNPLPPEQSDMLNSIVQDVRLCLKRCELILQLPEIKAFIRKFQSSLQVNAVLHDRWLGPRRDEDEPIGAPKIEQCKSMGDLTSVAHDPSYLRPKRGEVHKRPFRTVNDWARPHTPLTLDPINKSNGTAGPELTGTPPVTLPEI